MKKKEIKIDLLPEYFIGSEFAIDSNCPLCNAIKRSMPDVGNVSVGTSSVGINGSLWTDPDYLIPNGFYFEDFEYIQAEYLNPNCNKIFQVILIPAK